MLIGLKMKRKKFQTKTFKNGSSINYLGVDIAKYEDVTTLTGFHGGKIKFQVDAKSPTAEEIIAGMKEVMEKLENRPYIPPKLIVSPTHYQRLLEHEEHRRGDAATKRRLERKWELERIAWWKDRIKYRLKFWKLYFPRRNLPI